MYIKNISTLGLPMGRIDHGRRSSFAVQLQRDISISDNLMKNCHHGKSMGLRLHGRRHRMLCVEMASQNSEQLVTFTSNQLKGKRTNNVKGCLYGVMSLSLAYAGVMLLSSPSQAFEYLFQATPSKMLSGLLMVLGAQQLVGAVTLASLSHAAFGFRLSSNTYKRLNVGMILWGLSCLVAYSRGPLMDWSLVSKAILGLFAVVAAIPLACSEGLFVPVYFKVRLLPKFTAEEAYKLGVMAAAGFGSLVLYTSLFGSTHVPLTVLTVPLGSVGQLALQLIMCGMIPIIQVLFSLMDADRRGRLAASTFRALNLVVAGFSCVVLTTLHNGTVTKAGPKLGTILQMPSIPKTATGVLMAWPDILFWIGTGVMALLAVVSIYQSIFARNT